MKKFFLCLICLLLLNGCFKKDDFKHYDLRGKPVITYTSDGKNKYVLSDITPENYESVLTGLFLEVDYKDYILLETLESSTTSAYNKQDIYTFHDGKLYGVGNGDTPMIFEIDLKGKNSKLKELNFKVKGTENSIFGNANILNVYNDRLTISGYIFIENNSYKKNFICSLTNYECEILDTNGE